MLFALAQGAALAEPGFVLRSTTNDDLTAFLQGDQLPETAWLSRARQHEEAWFLGLRLNAGVDVSGLEKEFGKALVAAALEKLPLLEEDGLLTFVGDTVRLTRQGQLLSNEVFQQFLGLEAAIDLVTSEKVS
jgi:oxygen-independent coproporphyrinogen-3 oxidase